MGRLFGLEVEYGGQIASVAQALHADGLSLTDRQAGYIGNSDTHWVVKSDASVPRGGELVGPPLDFENEDHRAQVNRAIKAVRSTGATTDSNAGIHVHVDARDLTGVQVAAVARSFIKFEDIIYRLGSSGWREIRPSVSSYCKPFTQAQVNAIAKVHGRSADEGKAMLERAYYGAPMRNSYHHGDHRRYYALNVHSWFYRGTIEFRVFNSSLNADRIQAYIAICMAMVTDAANGKRRSVNKAYRLGGMQAGTTNADAAYHRFQQVMRYEAGMSLADYKLMNRCWKDSVPQRPIPSY